LVKGLTIKRASLVIPVVAPPVAEAPPVPVVPALAFGELFVAACDVFVGSQKAANMIAKTKMAAVNLIDVLFIIVPDFSCQICKIS